MLGLNLDKVVDETTLVQGFTDALNNAIDRIKKEILEGKKVTITITVEDREPAKVTPE